MLEGIEESGPQLARSQIYETAPPCRVKSKEDKAETQHAGLALKRRIIHAYGGSCYCCREAHIEFLTIDHAYGDGKADREKHGVKNLYRAIEKDGYPQDRGYRVACMNCNWAAGLMGSCPLYGQH